MFRSNWLSLFNSMVIQVISTLSLPVGPQHAPEPPLSLLLQKLLLPANNSSADSPEGCQGLNLGQGSHQEQQGTGLESGNEAYPWGLYHFSTYGIHHGMRQRQGWRAAELRGAPAVVGRRLGRARSIPGLVPALGESQIQGLP